ncbi:probable ubiquitin carboxyl-terminal hydrolase MINDY-4 isoform X2 [Eriocheir sinensis]|uniref:probable ubiquitin carboxyl-terminal hydrolase MINDY-4 isoform X2 n=1 Tax=Eriocheir sinensis TaxID=95602 RepID=UPI0021C5C86F|nr:probable ubiquitin carboxyl-terminal hydrolase MINDY-4 isoform X2 [Eriocheir sinensis]XP_050736681.1 probable ubiquitin carboxyl-terminal hydrolase MINDY-4 isoform X2 [Eriocheir sinensis]
MPKLYWRSRNEEGGGDVAATRPGTQEASAGGPRLWPGGGEEHSDGSPKLLKINTHSSGLKTGRPFDRGLDTFRSNSIEVDNGLDLGSPLSHRNGHVHNGLRNGSLAALRVPAHGGFRNSSGVSLAVHGRSEFDTEADVDIATMAAQRDQLRGARNVRGMMAPVMSKEDEARGRSANRKMMLTKQRSESVLDSQEEVDERGGMHHRGREVDERVRGDAMGGLARRGTLPHPQGRLSGFGGLHMRPVRDYLESTGRGDIMAQSMRRQSLRGSKLNLFDGNVNQFESNGSSRLSMDGMTSDEPLAFRQDDDRYSNREEGFAEGRRKSLPKFIPSSHEDIQILNLQGFMDASGFMEDGRSSSRRKHKKKRLKRGMEGGDGDRDKESNKVNGKPRRKRTHRLSKNNMSDDDEMVLKDVDDLDKQVAGLVLGPEAAGKETAGRPITLEEATELRNLLTGSPAQPLSTEWLTQNFKQNTNPNLSYGIVQKKGGPCGVLACVQAYMMKCLIFGTTIAPTTSPVSPLRPSQREWLWALAVAVTEILWKAGQGEKAILAMPGSFAHFTEHGVGRYSQDGMTENLTLHEFVEQKDLYDAITRHLTAFTSEASSGCVILLYSLVLTRGITNITEDMDPGGGHLINSHGYSSQEIVNLLLTGRAFTNTFNGDHKLGNSPSRSMVLRGITQRAEIGLLSLFEHYDCYKVGTHLKTPQYPIWVVCCESHYSCLFSRDTVVASDNPPIPTFDIFYYDGLALQEDEIRLTIELSGEESDLPIVPPLEHCIRTKWKNAAISWNGTDPIL